MSSGRSQHSRVETACFIALFTFIGASMVARFFIEKGSPWYWVFTAGYALMTIGFLVAWIRILRKMDPFKDESPDERAMVEVMELWRSPLSASAAAEAIARSFSGSSAKVQQVGDVVRVRTGSNWRYRLLGNSLSGSEAPPVALDVKATSTVEGSTVEAHAYDTLGWRMTDRTFSGAEKVFDKRLMELLTKAAAAAEVVDRSTGTAGHRRPTGET